MTKKWEKELAQRVKSAKDIEEYLLVAEVGLKALHWAHEEGSIDLKRKLSSIAANWETGIESYLYPLFVLGLLERDQPKYRTLLDAIIKEMEHKF